MPSLTMTEPRPRLPTRSAGGALVWIDRRRAIVTQRTLAGDLDMQEFPIHPDTEGRQPASLGAVVHAVRDCTRLTVLGTDEMRTLLERQYVAMVKAPDRIVDGDDAGPLSRSDLADRFRGLA